MKVGPWTSYSFGLFEYKRTRRPFQFLDVCVCVCVRFQTIFEIVRNNLLKMSQIIIKNRLIAIAK